MSAGVAVSPSTAAAGFAPDSAPSANVRIDDEQEDGDARTIQQAADRPDATGASRPSARRPESRAAAGP